jgi:hypothetical protein
VTIDVDDRAEARGRPTPEQTFAAAVDLVTRSSGSFKRFALRYSLCTADAEDAYQRSLDILCDWLTQPIGSYGHLRSRIKNR